MDKEDFFTLNSQISLAPLRSEDNLELKVLMKKIYPPTYEGFWIDTSDWYLELCYSKSSLEQDLDNPQTRYFFVLFNSNRVGILKYDLHTPPEYNGIENCAKIHRLYLAEHAHGKGIAKALMAHVEKEMEGLGFDSIWLETMQMAGQAKRFYTKMGYKKIHSYILPYERLKASHRQIEIWIKWLS